MGSHQQILLAESATFNSFSVPNLEMWLKADDITGIADDGNITGTWPDASGNSRPATAVQFGGSNWPRYRATAGPNSKPAVASYGAGSNLDNGAHFTLPNFMTGFTAGHVFCVMQKITKQSATINRCSGVITDWGTSTDEYFCFNTDSKIYDGCGSSTRKTTADPGDVTSAAFLYEIRTASGAWSNWKNGTSIFSTGTNTVSFQTAPKLMRSSTSTKHYDGYCSEILFFSRVLNSGEIATVKSYISGKYGLTIA